jgi:uncharacterized protein YbjT (DUF2867 family)
MISKLVIGGTGTVGSQVVRRLTERGEKVRVLTRSAEHAGKLPAGTEAVIGDLTRPESLPPAMQGMERLFLITPLSQTEADEGRAAVQAAQKAGIQHLVYMSVHDVERGPHVPHFKSKIEIQQAIERSGIPWTFVMPNNFYQNDFWSQQPLLEYGVYPQPVGDVGLSRVDVRDIADAVVNALGSSAHLRQRYPLVGPTAWTGPATAATWGRFLGKEIRYGGNDLDAWAEQAKRMLPEWLVHDFRIMYEFFQEKGLVASTADLAQQHKVLGHAPRTFEDFARETAESWKSQARL